MKKFFMCLILVFLASSKIATAQQVVNNVREGFTPAYLDADPFMVNAIYRGYAAGYSDEERNLWIGYFSKTGFPTLVVGQTYGLMLSDNGADYDDDGLYFVYDGERMEYDGCGLYNLDTNNPYFASSDYLSVTGDGVYFVIYTE